MASYNNGIITQLNKNPDTGQPISTLIQNEQKQIFHNMIKLNQIPDLNQSFVLDNGILPIGNSFVQIRIDQQIVNSNQFKIDDKSGREGTVYFHPSLEGLTVTVTKYYGKGNVLIDAGRIVTDYDISGNVKETLADLTDNARNQAIYAQTEGDYAKAQGDSANTATTNANNATNSANNTVTTINNETLTIYKPYVSTYSAIATTYPVPLNGWETVTTDTNTRYRYNSTLAQWIAIDVAPYDKIGNLSQIPETNLTSAILNDRSQLTDIMYNMTALKHDGTTDDSNTIQAIFDLAVSNKVKKLTFPKGIYRIDNPLYCHGSDIEIDFSGSTIYSYAKATGNVWGEIGLFNFNGSIVSGDIIPYMRTAYTTPNPPAESPLLLTYESIMLDIKNVDTSAFYGGRITTSNNSYFSIGDDIFLRGWTRPTGAPYDSTLYEPELTVVAKVTNIDATYIYVDYYSPYTYPSFIQSSIFKSIAIKCNLLKNIKIKNLVVIDKTTLTVGGFTPTAQEVSESISIIAPILCDNVTIENIDVTDHRDNAINPFYCRNIEIKNIKAKNARMWSGGQGYLAQIRGCKDIKAENLTGTACRHTIDFSFSCYAKVINAKGINNKSADLDLHGICEHDITFKKCQGYLNIGNGLTSFPNIDKNVILIDCDIELADNVDNATGNFLLDNMTIKDSRITISAWFESLNNTVENSKLTWKFRTSNRNLNKRNLTTNTSCIVKNCDFNIINGTGISYTVYFRDYDKLILQNLNFTYDASLSIPTAGVVFNFLNILDLLIDNIKIIDTKFRYQNTIASRINKYKFKNSDILFTLSEGYCFLFDTITGCTINTDITHNEIRHKGSAVQYFVLDARNTNMTSSVVINGNVGDNKFIGNINAKIHYIHSAVLDTTKETANIYDYNNIVISKDPAGSNLLSATRNFIVS